MSPDKTNGNFSVPKIAILLAAYNGMRWIEAQLSSILEQESVSVKVFISVDLSSDGTLAWCQAMALRYSCIEVLPADKRFGGAAPNFFRMIREVELSSFDYVSLADQDDLWPPEKLFRAHQMMSKIGADAYSSNVTAFWPDGRQVLIHKAQKLVKWDFLFEAAGPGCTYVIRKNLACTIQGLIKLRWAEFRHVGLHDWFIYAYARANGYLWVIDDQPGLLYRQHEQNQVGVNMGWRASLQRARKVLGGWGLAQSALIAELVGLGNDPFVRLWSNGSRAGLLSLSLHAWQCRRRLRDKFLFALSCAALLVAGKRGE